MSNPLHQTLMHTIKGKTLAYIVNVIPIMSERVLTKLSLKLKAPLWRGAPMRHIVSCTRRVLSDLSCSTFIFVSFASGQTVCTAQKV